MNATNAALAGALNFPQPARFLMPVAAGVGHEPLLLDLISRTTAKLIFPFPHWTSTRGHDTVKRLLTYRSVPLRQ